jgi:2-methylcitrate dehydratase PrpD
LSLSSERVASGAYTEALAKFATAASDFPPEVIDQGKRILLDQLACQIAGSTLAWSKQYRAASASLYRCEAGATVVYYGDRLPVDQAAFLNSCFGHANEYDDVHFKSTTHPGSVVVPAVLAVAENRHLSGKQLVEGVIVGSEVMCRIATAAAPHLHHRGHHTPPAVGPFGAAAGTARLMGLDVATMRNALAIAGSHSGGLLEYDRTGGSVKRSHCAIPSMAGVRSAVMAAHGITGPPTVLEGERGFLKVFAGEYQLSLLTQGLGERYLTLDVGFKPFACNGSMHGPLEALGWLQAEHNLGPDEIASILIGTSTTTIAHVGTIKAPTDILGAQFSLAFSCAVRILRGGNGFYDYREEDFTNPKFLDLAARVELVVDPICEDERHRLGNRGAIVTVTTPDGRRFEKRIQYSKGLPENPLSNNELTAKFVDAATPPLGATRAAHLAERIWSLEEMTDAADLLPLTLGL